MGDCFGQPVPFVNDAVAGVPVVVKSSGGILQYVRLVNTTGLLAYLQVFNKASGVVLGTTVPDFWIRLSANQDLWLPELEVDMKNGMIIAGTTLAGNAVGAAISALVGIS